jgi:dihydroorotate dehydrogenase electron transfer subunit
VKEVRSGSGGLEGLVACSPGAVPAPGRYLQAHAPVEMDAALGTPLFLSEPSTAGFWAAPPFPVHWGPGTELVLRGPLGRGFDLPPALRRLALAALGGSPARLLPLVMLALGSDCAVTLFTDSTLPGLPASVEIYPLASLRESLNWPDLLAFDLPMRRLPDLRGLLGLDAHQPLPCQAQALIWTPMPCAGIGECGACAVPVRRGYKLACADGPVFPLNALDW